MSSRQEPIRPSGEMKIIQVARNLTKDGYLKSVCNNEEAYEK